jgi:transcriptional regulator with XRE-family HTH domain
MQAERQVIRTLLKLLKVLGLSQKTVAERLEISDATLSQWKSGYRIPSMLQMRKISQLLIEARHEDMTHEDAMRNEKTLLSHQEREYWRRHHQNLQTASKAYNLAINRWMEQIKPGAGRESLMAETDQLFSKICEYADRGAKTLKFSEWIFLAVHASQLNEIAYIATVLGLDALKGETHDDEIV